MNTPVETEEIYLSVEGHFDAAHNLINYEGKCSNLHGHRWKVTVELGPFYETWLDKSGIAFDFKDAKKYLDEVIEIHDHQYLNNFFEKPSAEYIALAIFKELRRKLGKVVYAVDIYESPESRCRVVLK